MGKKHDTIYAISTPPGKSAIAVIRISGKKSFSIIDKISKSMPTKHNKSVFNKIIATKNETIDHTITTFYKAPKSYTGENMIEIATHGSNAVISKLLKNIKKNKNVREAEPGEFTRRAFENNKLDLTQVEAISDLVNAETEYQRKEAYNQLEGNTSAKLKKIYDKIKLALANSEAIIDFSDEDLPDSVLKNTKEQIQNIINDINFLIDENKKSRKIHEGYIVGIIGKTNAGKSSFINNISKQDISIVTNQPGTTRDIIESYVDIGGIPIRFFDSAGIRKSKNKIEDIGIRKSYKLAKNSDINLIFIEKISEIKKYKDVNSPIFVQSKFDIRKKPIINNQIINISSKNNHGIKKLLKKISTIAKKNNIPQNKNFSRERHEFFLINAKKNLENSKNNKNYDLFSEDIRLALNEISKIYGKTDIEDILDIVFNDFCIGK